MKHTKIISIILVCLAVLAGAGYVYASGAGFSGEALQEQGAEGTAIPQSVVRVGSLTVSITGSGKLVPDSEAALGFQDSGVVVEMNVEAGDEVKAGEVLARLQINKTPNELAADLASAELAAIEAQQALDHLYENAALGAAQALSALEAAQQALEELQDNDLEKATAQQALAEAQQAVADAEMQMYILNSAPSQEDMYIAYASLLFKEKAQEEIEEQVARMENQIKRAPNKTVRDLLKQQLLNLNVQLAQQRIDIENAIYKYNHLDDPADPIELAAAQAQLTVAQAQLAQAQRDWEEAQAGPAPGEIAQAEAELAQAQAEWERRKDGPDPEELAPAEARLKTAQAKLAQAQQEQLVEELVAPFDGIVQSVDAEEGDRLEGGTILTLADISQPLVEVYFDETDLEQVQVGNKAAVAFDAFPDSSFTGQVVEVDPGLAQVNGADAVRALVLLDEIPADQSQTLPVGLSANVDIISGQVNNALLVPVEALHEISPGEYAVYMIRDGKPDLRRVSVGIKDATTAQITGGLAAGEAVTLGDVKPAENIEGER